MSTTKVTPQKVIAVLKKAGLKCGSSASRFSSGFEVRGVYEGHEYIEIMWRNSSWHKSESYSQSMVEKHTTAASVLLDAGLTVLMNGKIPGEVYGDDTRHDIFTLYVRKDGAPQTQPDKVHWDLDQYAAFFQPRIQEELVASHKEQAAMQAKLEEAAKAQAERMARVNLLNPTIGIDHNYLEGLFTTHVTLLDGRMAVLTVAYTPKQEHDWDAMKDGDGSRPMYNCFEVELTYITKSQYQNSGWERGTSTFTTGKGENLNDGLRYWISRQ